MSTNLRTLITLFVLLGVTVAEETLLIPHLLLKPTSIVKSLGNTVYISCQAIVPNVELVSEMKWHGPNGQEIPSKDTSIQTLDGGETENTLDLYIEKLRENHTGMYNCSALYAGNQNLNSQIMIKSFRGIDFKDTETVQKQIKGTDAKIKCHVSSEPQPFVDWLKDGKKIGSDSRHIIKQDGILIKNITEDDEGVYRCRARVSELGQILHRDIQVEVLVAPRITGPPQNISGVERQSATFDCVATGKPAPSYTWTNPESELVQGRKGYFVDEVSGTLTIIQLEPHHSGLYRCTASNAAGDVTSEATLTVHTKPRIEEHRNHTIASGTDLEMKCIVTGEPLPVVIFKKEVNEDPFVNGLNPDKRIEVIQNKDDRGRRVGILKIRGVQRTDDGLYTCKGNSSGGVSESWNHLTVEFPPTFEDQPHDEFWTWEGNSVNISCLATSIPNATIQWFLQNDPIPKNNQNLKVIQLGPNGILRVNPVSGHFFAKYRCEATNPLGTLEHYVTLSQVRKPGPVSSVQVKKKTATTIEWTLHEPQDDGGRPVVGFTVQYRLIETSWEQAEIKYFSKGSGSTYLLDKLTPNAEYVFRFAAKNDVDNGEWSGETSERMPNYNTPEEPYLYSADPMNVKTVPYSDRYDLQWEVPLDNGKDIDLFQIIFYPVRNESGIWTALGRKMTQNVDYPGNRRFTIEDLSADSYYKVELRAHNELGFSTPGEVVFKTAFAQSHIEGNPTKQREASNIGLIIGVLLVVLILVLIAIDVTCFFTKKCGVLATVFKKDQDAAKDKEAMLEDGVNTSSKGNNKEKSESMAEVKNVDENSKKEAEPTETTPMIEGESDKEKIRKEEQQHQQTVEDDDVKGHIPQEDSNKTKDSAV